MANKKAEILTMDGQVVSPITLATNVLLDEGRTAQDLLDSRDESMFSPTIATSSSMSKVGQGDSVDYSENVVDGAYESCVLKGNTKVNLIQESSSQDVVLPYEFAEGQSVTISDTKESGALGVELKGQTLVNLVSQTSLENSHFTDYTLSYIDKTRTYLIKYESSKPISNIGFIVDNTTWNKRVDITETKTNGYVTIKPNESLDVTNLRVVTSNSIDSYTLKIMMFEYQEGMENWDIPYFEGMQSVRVPSVTTVGKNLLPNPKQAKNGVVNGSSYSVTSDGIFTITGTATVNGGRLFLDTHDVFELQDGKMYSFIMESVGNNDSVSQPIFHLSSEIGKYSKASVQNSRANFTYLKEWGGLILGYNVLTGESYNGTYRLSIIEGNEYTTYEPYKSTTLTTPEEIALRGIGNVKDTLNTVTGEYTQRIGEIVLDGLTGWLNTNYSTSSTVCFDISINLKGKIYEQSSSAGLTCAELPPKNWIHFYGSKTDEEGVVLNRDSGSIIHIKISRDKLTTHDYNGVTNYLKQNPITVQYVLATPITKKLSLTFTNQDNQPTTKLSTYNTTTHINASSQEGSLIPTLSHSNPTYPVILKPSTKYSIVANSYSNGHTNSPINFNLGGATVSTTVGNRVSTVTTPSTLTSEKLVMSGRGNKLNNVMVIEGDVVGDEPYFEGMCDVEMPVVTNVGKNLFDGELETGNISTTTGENLASNDWKRSKNFIEVKPNHNYCFISKTVEFVSFRFYDINKKLLSAKGSSNGIIDTPADCVFMRFTVENVSNENSIILYGKSNTLSCNSEVDLRSLPNGACDTLDLMTGEYVQRICEIVLDGSDDEVWGTSVERDSKIIFYTLLTDCKYSNYVVQTDKFPTNAISDVWGANNIEGAYVNDAKSLLIAVLKTKLSSNNVVGIRQYLSQNPITVQYELATPIVSTIDVQGFPYAYENGHVILSSGSIEQSLTPTIEYSLIANRLGQIQTNQKLVEKQQAQIDELESMVVANLVNTQYQQALNEIKLGVK